MSLSTRIFTDLDLDFTAHPVTGDIVKVKDTAAIISSMSNLLQLGHYEKPFNPSMGSNLRRLLFEPMTSLTASELRTEIKTTIDKYEPRVKLEGIEVTPDEDNNQYNVTITFFLVNRAEPITINLFLERVR